MAEYATRYEFVEKRLRPDLYKQHPDFGNYGKAEKQQAIASLLESYNPRFAELDPAEREEYVSSLLNLMGESKTYSVAEAAWDIGVPMATGALGGLAAGPIGAIAGAGAGAGAAEALKAQYERHKRGIPLASWEEMSETAKWPAALEMGFQLGAPILSRAALGLKRKIFLPKGTKGLLRKKVTLPDEEIQTTQELLGKYAKRRGITHPFTPIGESLTLGQINLKERNLLQFAESVAGGALGAQKVVARRYKEIGDTLQEAYKELAEKMSTMLDDVTFGTVVSDMIRGEINVVKLLRRKYWSELGELLEGKDYTVDIGPLVDFLIREYSKKGRLDAGRVATAINDFLGIMKFKPLETVGVEAEDLLIDPGELIKAPRDLPIDMARQLLHRLNNLYESKSMRNAAGKSAQILKDAIVKTFKEEGDDELAAAFEKANTFHRESAKRIYEGLIGNLVKGITGNKAAPERVVGFIYGSAGTPKYSNLMALKHAFTGGRRRLYERNILKPLRFKVLNEAFDTRAGVYSGELLTQALKRHGAIFTPDGVKPGPYLKEVFGEDGFKNVLDFATALKVGSTDASGDLILIKFMQATEISRMARPARRGSPGAAAKTVTVFLTPLGLAHALTSKRLTRTLTDGIQSRIGSSAFARMVATVNRLNTQAELELRKMEGKEIDFYTLAPIELLTERIPSYARGAYDVIRRQF